MGQKRKMKKQKWREASSGLEQDQKWSQKSQKKETMGLYYLIKSSERKEHKQYGRGKEWMNDQSTTICFALSHTQIRIK